MGGLIMEQTVHNGSDRPTTGTYELLESIRTALALFLLLTLITGIAYPLVVTAVAHVVFPGAATGSIIRDGDRAVGSELIGQPFDDPRYFWGRPSATTPAYNGMGGSGSNQATTNPALKEAVRARIERLRSADPDNKAPVPIDLVTASGSGLDPHISLPAAEFQAARVARERGMSMESVRALIQSNTRGPTLGFLGQPRVHILRLNLALKGAK
jgi:potassium-transporting ATPase KdpC subunit